MKEIDQLFPKGPGILASKVAFVCPKMAMDPVDLERKDLVEEVKDVIGAMDFFQFAEGVQTFFI